MKFYICVFLLTLMVLPAKVFANFPEFFGASPETTMLGGQTDGNPDNAANNFYIPALLARSKKISLNASYNSVRHDFEPIENITTKNSTNHAYGSQTGGAKTDYGEFRHSSIHASIPVGYPGAGSVGLSIFSPVGHFIEVNTGDPFLPEYVMYHSRYRRTSAHFNYAHPLGENFSFSVGAYIGFQVRADMSTQASLSGSSFGSSASTKAKVAPALASVLSLAYVQNDHTFYFTFNQEMKSNLEANIIGDTADPPIPFNVAAESVSYYDPYVFRFGHSLKSGFWNMSYSVEYQIWEKYQTPVVRINKRIGVKSSDNYERVETQNIFVPKIGLKYNPFDRWNFSVGASYRPTPIKGNFSGPGNSVDTNTTTLAGGMEYRLQMYGKPFFISAGLATQILEEKNVVKSSGQENGTAGNKIGAPGYTVGGNVYLGTIGIRTEI